LQHRKKNFKINCLQEECACAGNGMRIDVSQRPAVHRTTAVKVQLDSNARDGVLTTHKGHALNNLLSEPYSHRTSFVKQIFSDLEQDMSPLPEMKINQRPD